ncbi:hypothetical protein GCM10023322_41740 [Rugosimonospora acidiphila]|uniref:YbjN domain-containing protein n=1 Tax=Rugosimonospora acidiphila TaxID=556531 RepID=A0ABP9RYP8_9ACTN
MSAEIPPDVPPETPPHAPPEPSPGKPPRPPAEAALLDDLAMGTDLKSKVTEAWRDFARALAERAPEMLAGTQLELTLDPTASGTGDAIYAVTLQSGPDDALGALAVGNASLPPGYRLDRGQVADLVELGWSPPGVVPGSGDDFGLTGTAEEATRIAVIITRTLRDIYGAPHPAFVTYAARGTDDEALTVGPLGTARPVLLGEGPDAGAVTEQDAENRVLTGAAAAARDLTLPLPEQVAAVVAGLLKTQPELLQVDGDGDIGIRSGSAMVFVRVRDNPPLVDVFSPVLTEVRPTEQLYVRLSELTNRMPIGRLYCTDDTVWASVPVFGRDFQATHLMLAVQVMTGLADELDDRLAGEFGGKRFFGDEKSAIGGGEHTGMYL